MMAVMRQMVYIIDDMKAIVMNGFGGPEVMSWGDTSLQVSGASLGKQEVIIQVHAAGVNNADLLQRQGKYPPPAGESPILGLEVAGTILECSPEATRWKRGARVMALLSGGGYAEQVAVHESQLMAIPDSWSFEQAAAVPEAFLTAYLELATLGELKPGESVLIHAGASGVGSAAIQTARCLGARVFTTAGSATKLARCLELGAETAINYREESFDEVILKKTDGKGVNCILDLVGAPHLEKNLRAIALEGRLLLVGFSGGAKAEIDLRMILARRIKIIGSTLRARPLQEKTDLIAAFEKFSRPLFQEGKLKPVLDRTFSIQEAEAAHRYLESHANIGKVILKLI
jgi:tumor protein p53-inducible protein 3